MDKIRIAVVGVGYLGQYHAEKMARLSQAELVAVCDVDPKRSAEIAARFGCQAVTDYQQLVGQIDAVVIATPTPTHYQIGRFFLENHVHVLMEKPITTSVEEADELIALAEKNKLKLQVGHLERFNNAMKALDNVLDTPRFIESIRLAPFNLRGSDVNVILDVMIHDIDLIQSIVNSELTDIRANGAFVVSPFIDIANARLEFANGCVATVTASRVSLKSERKLRVFQHDSYISLDLQHKKLRVHRKGSKEMFPGIPEITSEKFKYDKGDALYDQAAAFLACIVDDQTPIVSGEDGKHALETAMRITKIVRDSHNKTETSAETQHV